jgi:hypothetical protein
MGRKISLTDPVGRQNSPHMVESRKFSTEEILPDFNIRYLDSITTLL